MTDKFLVPLNSTQFDPVNQRGEAPYGQEYHIGVAVGALTAGKATIDVDSVFGKGLGEVYGIQLLNTDGGAAVGAFTPDLNPVLSAKAVLSATAGKVAITISTSDATSTDDTLVVSFVLTGRQLPVNA